MSSEARFWTKFVTTWVAVVLAMPWLFAYGERYVSWVFGYANR